MFAPYRWVSITACYSQLSLVATIPLLLRIVNPDSFGSYQIVMSIATITQVIFTGGAEYVIPSMLPDDTTSLRKRARAFLVANTMLCVVIALALFAAGWVDLAHVIVAGGGIGAVYGISALDSAYRASLGLVRTVITRNIVFGTLVILLQPLSALLWQSTSSLILPIVIARLTAVVATLHTGRSKTRVTILQPSKRLEPAHRPPQLGQNIAWVAGVLLANVSVQIPVLIVGVLSVDDAGQLAVAIRIVGVSGAILGSAISQGFALDFAARFRTGTSRRALANFVGGVQRRWVAIGLVLGGLTVVAAETLAIPLFGQQGRDIGNAVAVLALPFSLQIATRIVTPIYPILQRTGLFSWLQGVRLVLVVTATTSTFVVTRSTTLTATALALFSGIFYVCFIAITQRVTRKGISSPATTQLLAA